jgi:ubiquinone/menaquinone biosynthesis C-methylase UbiE
MFKDKDRRKCERLFEKYYAGRRFSRGQYKELIEQHVVPGGRLLDAGCGRYLEFSRELASDVQVVGIDLEEQLDTRNGLSPFAVRGNLETLPFSADSFDLVISRSVVEHLEKPFEVFQEFHRVLKPGGKVILSTPNKFDYVSIVAALTPYRWHRVMVGKMTGVREDDVFPTLYRANSLSSLGSQLRAAGFKERVLKAINHYPSYLMFSPILFRLGALYEKVTSLACLENLRGTLLCVFEKDAHPRAAVGRPRPEPSLKEAETTPARG